MARLGDVCTIVSGTTPKSSCPEYWDGDINWVTPAELNDESNVIYESQRKITKQAVVNTSLKSFPAGTVLLSSRAPIGKVAIAGVEMYCNQGFKNLICSEAIYNRYLYHFLKNKTEYLNSLGRGATFKEISKSIVEKIEIPLPPLEEQRRIAALLDKVSDLIAKRRVQLDKLDLLVKARFAEMFGKTQYPHTALIKLIVEGAGLSYGIVVPGDNVKDGVPMIRPSDFKNDNLYLEDVYRVAPEIEAKYARTRLIGDEILVQVIGQPGQVMLADIRCKGMNVTRNLAVIRPNCNRINRIYLKIYMQTQEAQAFMLGETKQSTLKQLPLSRLKELEIPVPSMALQEQFAAFVEQTEKSKLTIQRSLDKLETLKKALMQQYFG